MEENNYLWRERKKNCFGLPWTFTVYTLDDEKLCVNRGFLNTQHDELRLYRIKDFSVRCSLWQRLFGMGTVHICSADSSSPELDIKNVFKPLKVKDLIANQVEEARKKFGVTSGEFITAGHNDNFEIS